MPVPGIGYSRDEYRLYRSGKQFRAQYLQDNYLFEGFPGSRYHVPLYSLQMEGCFRVTDFYLKA